MNWCKGVSKNKVTIVYDTMHHSTDLMAQTIAEGIMAEGVAVKVCILKDGKFEGTHRTNVVTEILDSKAVLVGSPTLQDEVYPTVADFLVTCTASGPAGSQRRSGLRSAPMAARAVR